MFVILFLYLLVGISFHYYIIINALRKFNRKEDNIDIYISIFLWPLLLSSYILGYLIWLWRKL